MDAIILARAQFAFTVSFHFLFPAFSIGLASYLAVHTDGIAAFITLSKHFVCRNSHLRLRRRSTSYTNP